MRAGAWNHNIHYRHILLEAVPGRCKRVLDVGCGEGGLARELRRLSGGVTAIDADEKCIRVARRHDPGSDIGYVVGDFLTFPFAAESFDFVVCVAALHHMDEEAALRRMALLLRPGGVLAVLGLARSRWPIDLPRDLAAVIVNRACRLGRGWTQSSAPTLSPPPHTYSEIELLVQRTLPRARLRRHLLWRYSLVWSK